MSSGGRTPEELELLLEDAFLLRDGKALARLFDDGAVLAEEDRLTQARGGEEIAQFAAAMWARDAVYVAAPRRVLQARDATLVVAEQAINVLRRGSDNRWRFSISLLNTDQTKGSR